MLRAIFHVAAGLSLAVMLAALVFWVRSYRATDTYMRSPRPGTAWSLATGMGQVQWCQVWITYADPTMEPFPQGRGGLQTHEARHVDLGRSPSDPPERGIDYLGFQTCFGKRSIPDLTLYAYGFVIVPLWFIALMAAVLPAMALPGLVRAARRRRWRRSGRCSACGYDLRATAGLSCPECGAMAAG